MRANVGTKATRDSSGFDLSSKELAGSRGRCHVFRGRERSSSGECVPRCSSSATYKAQQLPHCSSLATYKAQQLPHCSSLATYKAQPFVASTLYHQKLLLPSQHSGLNGVSEESNSIRREAIFNPLSLIFESGSVGPKFTVEASSSLRALLFAFLLLSNCLLSSALRLDPAIVQGTTRLEDSIPGTSNGLTPNTSSPHYGVNHLSTYRNGNSMQVDDVREISGYSNPIPQGDILHKSYADWKALTSSGAVSTSQDKIQASFYRSSMLYASDGSSSGASSDPINNNGSETQGSYSANNSGTIYNSQTGRPLRAPDSCEVSNIKCALRTGCGMALQKYMLDCADLINGHTDGCDSHCRDSLLILTSTSEGRALMDCVCSNDYCHATKARLEVCRTQVLSAGAEDGALSCRLAHLVCTADTLCATAIAYYDKFCRRMFIGRSCSLRCNNSIAILQRQQQASRLETCHCDGSEPFACADIKSNMARLCFHQVDQDDREEKEEETNEVDTSPVGSRGPPSKSEAVGVTTPSDVISRLLLTSLLISMLQAVIRREAR